MKQTTRSLLTLAGLVLLAAAMGLFAYFGVHVKEQDEQAAKEKREKLFEFDKEKVKGLTVRAKGETTVLEKAGENWRIVAPVQAGGDKSAVQTIVERLWTLKSKSVVEAAAPDLAKYGLAQPAIEVSARVDGSPDLTLRVGEENAFDSSVYVTVGGKSEVLQAEGGIKALFEKSTFDLRDRRLLPFEHGQARSLEVRVDQVRYGVRKNGASWELLGATPERADEATVNKLLTALTSATAAQYVTDSAAPGDDAKYGLAKARLEVSVGLEGDQRLELLAGQVPEKQPNTKKTYARRKDTTSVAMISDSLFSELAINPAGLRDKTVLAFAKDDAAAVKITHGSETVELRREAGLDAGERWKITLPAAAAAKAWKVSSLLWALQSLKADAIVDDAKDQAAGLAKPARTITVLGSDGKELGTLLVGLEKDQKLFVKSGASPRVFSVDKSKLTEVLVSRSDLEETPVTDGGVPAP